MSEKTIFICTREAPWTPDDGTPVIHPRAYADGLDRDEDDELVTIYECPYCRHRFAKGPNHK